jgi:hypothetical protein
MVDAAQQAAEQRFADSWVLDYSRDAFPSLNENNLNEATFLAPGLADHAGHHVMLGIRGQSLLNPGGMPPVGTLISNQVVAEAGIRRILADKNGDSALDARDLPLTTLLGHEDWSELRYYFLESPYSPANAHPGEEAVETFTPDLVNPGGGVPQVAFTAATSQGSERTTTVRVPVSLSATASQAVTVRYAVSGGTATRGRDYTLTNGTLTFSPGTTQQTITIRIINDTTAEANETIRLTLSQPTNAELGTVTVHTYTILDDDALRTVSFQASSSRGNEAVSVASLIVRLSAASGRTVRVRYAVTGGTATRGRDYRPLGGTLTFRPGETTKTITINVVNDTTREPNETIVVSLSSPVDGILGSRRVHTYTILNDD